MATIEEIARRANVSKTAVSFVINGKPGVSAATVAHVRQVMDEMDYVPSALAQRFASQRSRTVALIALSYPRVFYDSRHAEMLDAVYATLEERDYALVLGTSNQRFLAQRKHKTMVRSGQVDGLLLMEPKLDQKYVEELAAMGAPLVILNSDGSHLNVDHVRTDDEAVGRTGAEYLLDLGHRRIGYVAGSLNTASGRDRLAGVKAALAEAGCPLDESRLYYGEYDTSEQSGKDGCKAILKAAPDTTAIFCGNDTMALGAMSAAQEMGLSLPEDLSLLGVDDGPANTLCRPQLATVRQDTHRIAEEGTRLLLDRLEGTDRASGECIARLVPPTLIARDSCTAPRS